MESRGDSMLAASSDVYILAFLEQICIACWMEDKWVIIGVRLRNETVLSGTNALISM